MTRLKTLALDCRPIARKVQGRDAVATWSLFRRRRLPATSSEQQLRMARVLQLASVDIELQRFSYGDREVAVRPSVARLLAMVLHVGGQHVPVAEVCAAVYGRPASLRAVRQSAFRASRVLERVDCPLVIHCQAANVFAQYRVRCFERRLDCRN